MIDTSVLAYEVGHRQYWTTRDSYVFKTFNTLLEREGSAINLRDHPQFEQWESTIDAALDALHHANIVLFMSETLQVAEEAVVRRALTTCLLKRFADEHYMQTKAHRVLLDSGFSPKAARAVLR